LTPVVPPGEIIRPERRRKNGSRACKAVGAALSGEACKAIFAHCGEGLIFTDPETGRILAANPAACRLLARYLASGESLVPQRLELEGCSTPCPGQAPALETSPVSAVSCWWWCLGFLADRRRRREAANASR
jgi:hypothetical protein